MTSCSCRSLTDRARDPRRQQVADEARGSLRAACRIGLLSARGNRCRHRAFAAPAALRRGVFAEQFAGALAECLGCASYGGHCSGSDRRSGRSCCAIQRSTPTRRTRVHVVRAADRMRAVQHVQDLLLLGELASRALCRAALAGRLDATDVRSESASGGNERDRPTAARYVQKADRIGDSAGDDYLLGQRRGGIVNGGPSRSAISRRAAA